MPFPIFNDSQSYQNTGIAPEIFSKASSAAVLNCRQQGIPPNFFFPRGIGCLPWFAPPPDSLSGSGAVEGGQVRGLCNDWRCPLKYKFRSIDALPKESVSCALLFGSGIHSAVKQHYQAVLSGDQQPDVEKLMFASRSAWLPHDPEAITFGSTENRASLDL